VGSNRPIGLSFGAVPPSLRPGIEFRTLGGWHFCPPIVNFNTIRSPGSTDRPLPPVNEVYGTIARVVPIITKARFNNGS